MNGFPSRAQVECVIARYPKGTRVRLCHMDDLQAPAPGTLGTVEAVDSIGTVHISWDNGSGLGACVLDGDCISIVDEA